VPPISFRAFLAIFLWALVAGIWLAAQRPAQAPVGERDVSLAAACRLVAQRRYSSGQLRWSRIWRLIRASIAAMPRSRSGLTRSCRPS